MLEINKLQKKYENFELNCSMKVEKGYITALVTVKTEQEKVQHLKRLSAFSSRMEEKSLSSGKNLWS